MRNESILFASDLDNTLLFSHKHAQAGDVCVEYLDGKAQGKPEKLWLRLPTREDPRMRKIKLALSFFPGESQAVLYFEDCKKRVGTRCQIAPSLVKEMKERLGENNVVVK